MSEAASLPDHVFVTGAASGIGKAVAMELLDRGSACCATDVDSRGLEVLKQQAPHGSRLITKQCDVADRAGIEEALSHALSTFGVVRGLVHAAGVLVQGRLHDASLRPEDFRRAMAVNLEGTWTVGSTLARHMVTAGGGSLVFVTSNAGTTPRVNMGAYCASKAGATMLARCFALELAPSNVRSNAVSPGSTDTPMLRSMLGGDTSRAIAGDPAHYRTGIPLGRLAQAKDVASGALFLLSSEAKHITGHDLRIDGGATWS